MEPPLLKQPTHSKVFERFVVGWLRYYIRHKIDPKQFGDGKGNSTAHYLVELLNFILHYLNGEPPNAVLMATIDFSKAYNRQNHNIIVTKLLDMGVHEWLINLVMGYIQDRMMVIRYKGETSTKTALPGGGLHGGLLGALLFIVLVNECGFDETPNDQTIEKLATKPNKKPKENKLHMKYVDNFTLLESLNLKQKLKVDGD